MRAGHENTISIVANSLDHVLDCIGRACCKHDMLWLHSMNRVEVGIEE